jgi:hypothetical protein
MALLEKLFGGKTASIADVEGKLADLETRRAAKRQAQAVLQQNIAALKSQVQETLAENLLSDDSGISKKRRDLRERMAESRRKLDELDEEIAAMDPLESVLNSEKVAAQQRLKVAEWDRQVAELLALSKEIEPLIASLGLKLTKAVPIISSLSGMTPNSAGYRPISVWQDSIRVLMARYLGGCEVPGVLKKTDVHSQIFAKISALAEYVEMNLERLRETLAEPAPEE